MRLSAISTFVLGLGIGLAAFTNYGNGTVGRLRRWAPLLAAPLLAGCYYNVVFKIRVIEFKCEAKYGNDWSCEERRVQGAELVYVVNVVTGTVTMWIVDDPGDGWGAKSVVYDQCSITNADNWQCDHGYGNIIRVIDGKYSRYNHRHDFPIGYDVRGVTGWRYWLAKGLSLLGMKASFLADR